MTSKDDLHGAKYNAVDPDAASIIEAALVHVPFDGWGQAALNAGAADAGFTADDVARLFPAGALTQLSCTRPWRMRQWWWPSRACQTVPTVFT